MSSDWKWKARAISTSGDGDRETKLIDLIAEAAGAPLSVRQARSRLYLLGCEVLAGEPRLVAVKDGAVVVLIALPDLVETLCGLPKTLGEALDEVGFKAARRTAIRVREGPASRRKGRSSK